MWLVKVWQPNSTYPIHEFGAANFEAIEQWADGLGFTRTEPPCDRPDYDALYTRADGMQATVTQLKTIRGKSAPDHPPATPKELRTNTSWGVE